MTNLHLEAWLSGDPAAPAAACSFCGRDQEASEILIAGTFVYICDACIGRFAEDPAVAGQAPADEDLDRLRHCSFCGKPRPEISRLFANEAHDQFICGDCLDLSAETLVNQRRSGLTTLT